jgi:hypothetical protein
MGDEVLKQLKAIEASAVLTELRDPSPHRVCGRVDGDGSTRQRMPCALRSVRAAARIGHKPRAVGS